jgi:tellurite resistance protein TehA-like permease
MVMATGIVSIAAFMLGMRWIAIALFAVTIAAYAGLVLLLVMRVIWYRDALLSDFADHQRAPGFFTVVAGNRTRARPHRAAVNRQ